MPAPKTINAAQYGSYKIYIDGEWSLEDLYIYPRTFEQIYFLLDSLFSEHDEDDSERVHHAFSAHPWYGGYSAVNFYNELKYITPPAKRPRIISIKYSSPGWIELQLIMDVVEKIAVLVTKVALSITAVAGAYNTIIKGLQDRDLFRLKKKTALQKLKQSELEYIDQCVKTLANALDLRNIPELNKRTGHPYITLKILLSLYRRVKTLVDYREEGKAIMPSSNEGAPNRLTHQKKHKQSTQKKIKRKPL